MAAQTGEKGHVFAAHVTGNIVLECTNAIRRRSAEAVVVVRVTTPAVCAARKDQGPTARYRARNSPKSQVGAQDRANGGESVSQFPLKDKAFLTFLGQNPPIELLPKTDVSPQSFHGVHCGSSKY